MSLGALIFDVDGTLADTEETHRQAFNSAFLAHDIEWEWSPSLYSQLLDVAGGKERIRRYIQSLDVSDAKKKEFEQRMSLIYATKSRVYVDRVQAGEVRLRPGVARLIFEAHAVGIRLGIATRTAPENVDALIRAELGPGALSWFSVIASGDVVPKTKPAPDVYEVVLGALRLSPDACVAIEDSEAGVRAAKAAGLFTIATPNSWTAGQDLRDADIVLDSLGSPEQPVDAATERRIGAKYVDLSHIETWHAGAASGRGATRRPV